MNISAAHAYVSLPPSRFNLETMSALGHVVFIWFHFKKQNEMKKMDKLKKKKNFSGIFRDVSMWEHTTATR